MDSNRCSTCDLPLALGTPTRRHECPFCGRTFRRVDGAKRHSKTCPSRGNSSIPQNKRGRKVHSCDECSRMKVSCNSAYPCSRCTSRIVNCTYGRICINPSHVTLPTADVENPQANKLCLSLPFLLACTDPCIGTIDEVILQGEPDHISTDPHQTELLVHNEGSLFDTIDPRLLCLGFNFPILDIDEDSSNTVWDPHDNCRDASSEFGISDEELQIQLDILREELDNITIEDPSPAISDQDHSWHMFFVVSTFRESIRVFFMQEELLASLIHKHTICLATADPSLLLAVAIAGYTHLMTQREMYDASRLMFALREVSEQYIFHNLEQLLGSNCYRHPLQRSMEICQAAYIIETLQFSVKNAETNRRLIIRRHPVLVAVLRIIDVDRDRDCLQEFESRWHAFIYTESCTRLKHWLFINDAWFSLLSNHPPAMTFLDMRSNLPCTDELWTAHTSEIFTTLSKNLSSSKTLCLRSLMMRILGTDWDGDTMADYLRLHVKHFLVFILGKYVPS